VPHVVIHPAFNEAGLADWKLTVDAEVGFADPRYAQTLSPEEFASLIALHPEGLARFWGSTKAQNRNYAKLRSGAIVLFTGDGRVQYVGKVGVVIRDNQAFGDRLWQPDPVKGSWINIYSLQTVEEVEIPYGKLRSLEGFSPVYPFRGLAILPESQGRVVLNFLRDGVTSSDVPSPTAEEDKQFAKLAKIAPAEAFKKAETSYDHRGGLVEVRRKEAELVIAYRATLAEDQQTTLRAPTGVADFYQTGPYGPELIEAKSSAQMSYIRMALGQLLDYVRFAPEPPHRIAALFPVQPTQEGISYLLHYGADCIYLGAKNKFVTREAPRERQGFWRQR
jgi:hypothetical protein